MDIASFRNELEQLYIHRVRSKIPRLTKEDCLRNGIIVFGASVHGTAIVCELLAHGITPLWIADNDPALDGKLIYGVPVRHAKNLVEAGNSYVILGSTHILGMIHDCENMGATWILPAAIRDFCWLAGEFGICEDGARYTEELASAFPLFADDNSRAIYTAFIRYHHTFENDFSPYRDPVLYFPEDLKHKIDYSYFLDAGAFIGDTLEDWIKVFKPEKYVDACAYYAFEPSKEFTVLESRIEHLPENIRKNVHPRQMALGAENCSLTVRGEGVSAKLSSHVGPVESGGFSVPVRRIDDLFTDAAVSIIKADVEGAELDLLRGGEGLLRRCRPCLAISVYHRYTDIWKIPLWIHELGLGYRIYLRHHQSVFTDTVCYAISCK